jgi:hypothetical protein
MNADTKPVFSSPQIIAGRSLYLQGARRLADSRPAFPGRLLKIIGDYDGLAVRSATKVTAM